MGVIIPLGIGSNLYMCKGKTAKRKGFLGYGKSCLHALKI
jgi:hypothetical protein